MSGLSGSSGSVLRLVVSAACVVCAWGGAAHGQTKTPALPEHVYLKSPTRGLAWENEYALADGKLWVRPNEERTGKSGSWALFDGTGVPFGDQASSFKPTDHLVQFGTDGTMILAVSNTGRFYNWQPTLSAHTVWMDKMGAPFAEDLWLPKSRAWAFSFSVDVAPEKRVTPMHDIVSYYEDADGNKIQFGFTATLFVLDPDGQRIRFWDTGLPASFHKAFATPDRGRFVAVNLSAAASTIFVVDQTGRMFTVMHDYEMFAACPGLRYTYQHQRRTKSDDEVMPLLKALRTLPLPDWRAQPAIPLEGKAVMTSAITILQNGKGNAARELRVAGRDRDGRDGYWFKPIFAPAWAFRATGQALDPATVIDHPGAPPLLGPEQDKTYVGKLERNGAPPLDVELVDFYYYGALSRLRVHLGKKSFDVNLHTADAWGPLVQQKFHPELVGSVAGEPKLLMATLQIPPEVAASTDPEVKKALETYFKPYDLVTFAFEVAANDRQVTLRSRSFKRDSTQFADYKVRPNLGVNVSRTVPDAPIEVADGYTWLATLPGLEVPDLDTLKRADLPRLDKAIEQNKAMLKQLKERDLKARTDHLTRGLLTATGAGAFYVLDGIVNVVGLPSYHTLAGGLSMSGGAPLNMYARLNLQLALDSTDDYQRAVDILERRLERLTARRAALAKKG